MCGVTLRDQSDSQTLLCPFTAIVSQRGMLGYPLSLIYLNHNNCLYRFLDWVIPYPNCHRASLRRLEFLL